MKHGTNGVLTGVLAAIVFIVLLIIGIAPLPSAILGFVTLAALLIVLRPKKGTTEVEKDELKDALAEGKQKLQDIRALGRSIRDASVRTEVAELSGVIEKILGTISEDSKKLRPARQFLGFYLDSTIKIIRTYAELESKGVRDAEIQASMAKAQGMLGTIRDAFDKQLAKLLSGDVLDLDAELSLMQQTIDMEGLGKGAGTKSSP